MHKYHRILVPPSKGIFLFSAEFAKLFPEKFRPYIPASFHFALSFSYWSMC